MKDYLLCIAKNLKSLSRPSNDGIILYLLYGTEEPFISASQDPEAPGLSSSPAEGNLHQLARHGLVWPGQSLGPD